MRHSIYDFDDYRNYLQKTIESLPLRGKGELKKIAQTLRVHSSFLSQVFSGKQNFSLEQTLSLAVHFSLDAGETEYLLGLVQMERAGNSELRKIFAQQLGRLKKSASETRDVSDTPIEISKSDRTTFYSAWYYSGVRLTTSISGCQNIESISKYLSLPQSVVERVAEFLINSGLCIQKGDQITIGPRRTHLEDDLSVRARNHLNWRIKAIERHSIEKPNDLFRTFPMSLNAEDAKVVRRLLLETIEKIEGVLANPSPPDRLACLNIDWFGI